MQPGLDKCATIEPVNSDEFRAFAKVMKAALLMIIRYLERRYQI